MTPSHQPASRYPGRPTSSTMERPLSIDERFAGACELAGRPSIGTIEAAGFAKRHRHRGHRDRPRAPSSAPRSADSNGSSIRGPNCALTPLGQACSQRALRRMCSMTCLKLAQTSIWRVRRLSSRPPCGCTCQRARHQASQCFSTYPCTKTPSRHHRAFAPTPIQDVSSHYDTHTCPPPRGVAQQVLSLRLVTEDAYRAAGRSQICRQRQDVEPFETARHKHRHSIARQRYRDWRPHRSKPQFALGMIEVGPSAAATRRDSKHGGRCVLRHQDDASRAAYAPRSCARCWRDEEGDDEISGPCGCSPP